MGQQGSKPSAPSRDYNEQAPHIIQSSRSAPLAQHAVNTMSDSLSGLEDPKQAPMPAANAPRIPSAKKTTETKSADFGQTLGKRKSQDFKSKIVDWNDTGAGVAQRQDEVVVVEDKNDAEESAPDVVIVAAKGEKKANKDDAGQTDEADEATPDTPRTPRNESKDPTKQSSQKKAAKDVDADRKAWVRRKSKATPDVTPEIKEAVTPKKRIVSDGHWRRDRIKKTTLTPEKESGEALEQEKVVEKEKVIEKEKATQKEKTKDTTPKPITVRRSVVSVGLKVPPSVQDFKDEAEPAKRRPLIKRTRSQSESRDREDARDATPDYESSGTKVYIQRRRRAKTAGPEGEERKPVNTSESSFTAASSVDKRSSATDITIPEPSPVKEYLPRPKTAPKDRTPSRPLNDELLRPKSAKPSLETEHIPRRVSRREHEDDRPKISNSADRVRKTSKEFKIPSSRAPVPEPNVFGNRIQGWLAGMGEDPFTDKSESSLKPDPLDISRKSSRRVEDTENLDNDTPRRTSGRRRRSRPSLEPIDVNERPRNGASGRTALDDWLDTSAPSTLKRSGARRSTYSPAKDRMIREESAPSDDNMGSPNLARQRSRRNTAIGARDRGYPTTGNRLATIPSMGTFQSRTLPIRPRAPSSDTERRIDILDGSMPSRASDGDSPARNGGGLKRRLTKHSDLMSVLSLDREDDRGLAPVRSLRSRRPRGDSVNVGDLMNDLTTDELTYQRELRTLVDGVIPVLLQYVLSKNDSHRNPGSRQSSGHDNAALTQPIVDMGIALDRLKTSHKRIPMHDPNELLLWAQSAAKIYSEYIKVWRLGFKDVVVNLAPAEENKKRDGSPAWDDGIQRNEHGDLLNGDGERVDVAFLLKRPLIRLKYIAKTIKSISQIKPSALADDMTRTYQDLVQDARKRANDEKGRLEDEAAAAIDPSRARDLCSLAPLSGVNIDPRRIVAARDYFDMDLLHTNGQQLGCKIEVIRRDDFSGGAGDVLFCEVSTSGRWLLFPPILAGAVSARKGDKDGEIIVMARGLAPSGDEWREVMSLTSTQEQGVEWVEMLGSNPMPPKLTKQSSFNTLRLPSGRNGAPPSPAESELPIGERPKSTARRWDGSEVNNTSNDISPSGPHKARAARYRNAPPSPLAREESWQSGQRYDSDPGRGLSSPQNDRTVGHDPRPRYGHGRSNSDWTVDQRSTRGKKDYSVWLPSSDHGGNSSEEEDDKPQRRPTMNRRTSSVPSMDMPTVNKLRKTPQLNTPDKTQDRPRGGSMPVGRAEEPTSAPAKLQKRQPSAEKPKSSPNTPSSETQNRPASLGLKSFAIPSFTPAFLKKHRRSSSPLKHEYEPSTASESSSDSDLSDANDNESITSESTADEAISTLGSLRNFSKFGYQRPTNRPEPPKATFSVGDESLGPSESASQGPYRSVPPTNSGSAKSVACIFAWSERGTWEGLHPEECEIVVTPGLIEAFDLAQANAATVNAGQDTDLSPSAHGVRPLIALELTPLVPLRRGTALDISIRSPPTANSVLRKGNNMMFRSRSPEECEKLYNLINRARIDNPTWIALQNARGPMPQSNWGEVMDRRNNARPSPKSASWIKSLSRKSGSYRSKGARSASIAASQSSVASMNSAFSALRRFSGGSSRIFNVAKSTIMSKESTRSTNSDSLGSGAVTPIPIDPSMGTPVGITNAKIRLYIRESASKWRDMGAGRLTIMIPPRPDPSIPADPRTTGQEKRVVVYGKSKGEVLLDQTLGETCFERIARTGIAVSVWQEGMGPNGELGHAAPTGGVVSSRVTVYMLQMKSERDAAFTFTQVGKLRY